MTFRVQQYSYRDKEFMSNFLNIVSRLGGSIRSLVSDPFLLQAFSHRIQVSLKGKRGDGYWSLAEIREKLKGERVKGGRWGFWFQKLLERTSSEEASLVLQKNLDRHFIEEMEVSDIWMFKYYYPVQPGLRKSAADKIYSAWKKGDPWLKYLVVELIANPEIKKVLAERESFFVKAFFQIERWFYGNLLKQGIGVHFAFYNLMRLGDNDRRNLWWMAF